MKRKAETFLLLLLSVAGALLLCRLLLLLLSSRGGLKMWLWRFVLWSSSVGLLSPLALTLRQPLALLWLPVRDAAATGKTSLPRN